MPRPHKSAFLKMLVGASKDRGLVEPRETLLASIKRQSTKVSAAQGSYQPLYGLDQAQESQRRALLTSSCKIIEDHYKSIKSKGQVRIVDVGCNVGFVTMTLAKEFPTILGLEIDQDCLDMAILLAQAGRSSARFSDFDLYNAVQSDSLDLENIDCILLLNVVHQFIFRYGLQDVRTFFRKLSRSVDTLLVELATRSDYVPHKKDHLLPIEAEEVFADLDGSDVKLLRDAPRPLYLIQRRELSVANNDFAFSNVTFSEHKELGLSRKYYSSPQIFVKEVRFSDIQGPEFVQREVDALLKLRDKSVAPELLAFSIDENYGRIATRRVYGKTLLSQLAYLKDDDKIKVVVNIIKSAGKLADAHLYHNDLSAHNIILTSDLSVVLLDFEHTAKIPMNDAFGFLLWIIHDVFAGQAVSYHRNVYEALSANRGQRADRSVYPDLLAYYGHPQLGDLIKDAETTDASFADFAMKWAAR